MSKGKKNEFSQKNNLLGFLSPIKRKEAPSVEKKEDDINEFVFKPQESSPEIIKRKRVKEKINENLTNCDENFDNILSNSSENEKSSFYETSERTPISDTKKQERFSFLKEIKDKNGIKKGATNYDPTTLFISESEMNKLTEFEKQFWTIKKDYFDSIVFFKKGKFYELYEEDAEIGSKLFDLKLTERVNMKMAGFPEKSYEYWAGKFLEHGYKVSKVDQVENMVAKNLREKESNKKDKIIKRELKEVITAGTVYNSEHLKSFNSNFLGIFYFSKNVSFILYEASINKIYFGSINEEIEINLRNLIYANEIKEIIYENEEENDFFTKFTDKTKIYEAYKFKNDFLLMNDFYENIKRFSNKFNNNNEFKCLINLVNYMIYLKRENFLETVEVYDFKEKEDSFISLDNSTIYNLELIKNNYDQSQRNTLFSKINFCVTGNGQRFLKKNMLNPFKNINDIIKRQNMTKEVLNSDFFPAREILKQIGDLERIFGKLCSSNPLSKDVILFINALRNVILLNNKLKDINLFSLPEVKIILDEFEKKYFIEENEILPEKNSDDELNELKKKETKIYSELLNYLNEKKKELKCDIKFKNIGKEIFQMEIPSEVKVPSDFILVSTTKNTRRFYTSELKELIKEYIENEEMIFQSKGSLLRRVIKYFMNYKSSINELINELSKIDLLFSFAVFALTYETIFPSFKEKLNIQGIKNPIYNNYIETNINLEKSNVLILTGPNMGGKSTLMRSLCYNTILAQMGMKVFASLYETKVYDNIFTRIGASDNLEKGESTFFIELNETSNILNKSTKDSFIIMDELGRGTSVKDGKAIATAVLNYLKKKGCTLLFSTHYFDIVEKITDVNKGYMDVEVKEDEVFFKYQLVNGVSYDSLGIAVAKIANLPDEIIQKALFFRNNKQN